jgi:hypothetical protein
MSETGPDPGQHPRGTLVIMLIFALLLLLGWAALYLFLFLPRGRVGA